MIYTATFAAVTVTAAQDVFSIVAPADTRVRLLEVELFQYSDAAELLSIQFITGYTVAGSGGAAVTPANVKPWSGAFTGTVRRNDTTLANTGTAVIRRATAWNIEAGFLWRPIRDADFPGAPSDGICIEAAERLVIRQSAPVDEITMSGTIVFETLPRFNT